MRRRRIERGLTLVELLTVCAVAILLLALLMPAVLQSLEAARRSGCQYQLHQQGVGYDQYFLDPGRRHHERRYSGEPPVSGKIARCPDDSTYYLEAGFSYEEAPDAKGKTPEEFLGVRNPSNVWILRDFGPFHGPPGTAARNYLYLDGHVAVGK